jgi:hypothetical protein
MKEKTGGGGGVVILVVGGILVVLLVCIFGAGVAGYMFLAKRAENASRPIDVAPATSCPPGKPAAIAVAGLVLPDVTGLAGKEGAGADVRGSAVARLTVLIDKWGAARVEGMDAVGKWRGTNFPKDAGPTRDQPQPRQLDEIVIHIRKLTSGGVEYRIRRLKMRSIRELAGYLAQLRSIGAMPIVVDPQLDVPFGPVAGVVAAAAGHGLPLEFRPPKTGPGFATTSPAVKNKITRESVKRRRPDGLSDMGVRIRADARAPWKSVAGLLMACMQAKVYRVAFSGVLNGAEVTIGREKRSKARLAAPVPAVAPGELEPSRIPELKSEIEIEKPVIIHEKFEVEDHLETEDEGNRRNTKDAISDIPLGATGIMGVGGGGRAGCFGYRDGGGRRKAVARFGGSPATESAVEAALRWLARHQEADGSWKPEKWGAAKGASPEQVSALATLAFLGAGHSHKSGKFRGNVRRAVSWLGKQQKADGSIGGDVLAHALCTQALAESYGMSRSKSLKPGAQRAVDHLLKAQKPYSGWPKAKPDLETTAAVVVALKTAKTAGLMMPASGFQGAMAFLGKVTDKQGRCRNRPGDVKVAPSMSARGVLSKMLMGMPPTDKGVAGGVKHMLGSLPVWGEGGKGVAPPYWYWGTMAAFQASGDSWKKWNRATRGMLCDNQRKGGPGDGSWDPVGNGGKKLGRVGSTALATMCLESYYRYLRIHTK